MKRIAFSAIGLLILLGFVTSCGGAGAAKSVASSAQNSTVQVTIGDAPGDSVVSFSVSVDSIVLTKTSGGTVSLLADPTRVELTHLAGSATPIATVDIPQDSYNQVTVVVSSPQVTIVHPTTGETITRTLPESVTRTIRLDPALALGGSAVNLNLDLSVADSVSVDANGNVSFNPKFLVRHEPLKGSPLPPRFEPLVGRVDTVSGSVIVLSVRFGQGTVRINTNDQTTFAGVSGINALTPGMLVSVFAVFGEDGKLLAKKVISLPPPATLGLEGLVKTITGLPVTQFQLIAQDGIGGLPPSLAGRVINVNIGGGTVFAIDSDGLDLTALPFSPSFSAGSLKPGQAVEVHAPAPPLPVTDSSVASTVLNASHVTLASQPLAGQVTGFSGGNTFSLILPPESAMARLTGTTSLTVFMQPGKTTLAGPISGSSVTLTNNTRVIVRGLLFVDGGQYKLVANAVFVP